MSVKVRSIYKRFGGKFVNKSSLTLNREISIPSLTRLGMELSGVFYHDKIAACVVWGKQENRFILDLSKEKKEAIFKKIFSKNPPLFLISSQFEYEESLSKLNEKYNEGRSAIIKLVYSSAEIFTLVGVWLAKSLATWTTIHATVIAIFGVGVLIIGEPGIGKSELALELLKMNHLFLGDDAIDIARIGNAIIARPNYLSKDFIQIRGLGILNVEKMYGGMKIIDETKIHVVIELKHASNSQELQSDFENLGEKTKYKKYLDINIPHYILPVTKGRNMSEIVELAVIDYKIKKHGYNSAKKFDQSLKKHLIGSEKVVEDID